MGVWNIPRSPEPVRIGCAGWNIPRHSSALLGPGASHLERYSRRFNSCEINSSFYRPHRKKTWERWASSVPAGFRFSVKAPRTITREAKLGCDSGVLSAFFQQVAFLQDKLGPILIQLPPSLEFDSPRANSFLSMLRENYSGDVVWEPRHRSWFADRVDDLLKDYQIARVAADPACVPAAGQPGGLSSLAYLRLHGSPRRYYSAYSVDFLASLSEQLVNLATRARVWCIFDNTASGSAIQNALGLSTMLEQSLGLTAS
jgi:uncharacterized protein YecE (DUF72 family)